MADIQLIQCKNQQKKRPRIAEISWAIRKSGSRNRMMTSEL